MNIGGEMDYGIFSELRGECYKKFGGVFDLPIVADPYLTTLGYYVDGNILDVGAGREKIFWGVIQNKLHDGRYYSLDNDPKGKYDYRDFTEIPIDLCFSMIFGNQVLEHLEIDQAEQMAKCAFAKLVKGGIFILTVPNTSHPVRQWGDVTHKTAWNYNAIYPLLKSIGFDILFIARYSKKQPSGFIEKFIANQLASIYRIDWCDSIIVVGQK